MTPPPGPPQVDVAFDCLPLRQVARLDVPLDASEELNRRAFRIKAAFEKFGPERTYYLYNGRCVYRLANSEIEGVCRFEYEGVIRTDAGDRKCLEANLEVRLASETCGGVPAAVTAWLARQVERAVAIEFDRFILAGQLAAMEGDKVSVAHLGDLGGPEGMGV